MPTDRLTVRVVAIGLIVLTLTVTAALVYILAVVSLTPEQRGQALATLQALGTGAAGAVAALLVSTSSSPPAPVSPPPAAVVQEQPGLVPGPG